MKNLRKAGRQYISAALNLSREYENDKNVAAEIRIVAENYEVETAMTKINEILKYYGVEAVRSYKKWHGSFWQNTMALYCNAGDTYDTTVIYDVEKKKYLITSVGDWIEKYGKDCE